MLIHSLVLKAKIYVLGMGFYLESFGPGFTRYISLALH